MPSHAGVHRLAVVAAALAALAVFLWGVVYQYGSVFDQYPTPLIIGAAALLAWGAVHAVRWVVAGFAPPRDSCSESASGPVANSRDP